MSVLYQRNYFIFLQWVYTKVILPGVLMGAAILFTSLHLRLAEPYHLVQRKLPTYTKWYVHCRLVSGGPGYVWLAEPYHVVPLKSSTGIGVNIVSFLNTIQTPNMLCRPFDDRKYMDIYLPIHQEYRYLGKQKSVCIFLHQRVNTCDLHLHTS